MRAVYSLAGGSAHNINVDFLNASRRNWQSLTVLSDTGSDITLIKREDGERIGFSPDTAGEPFMVGGVGAGAVPFKKFATLVRFQHLQPIRIDFGVAQHFGGLRDNLLGREDVLDNYNITFSKTTVIFSPREMRALHGFQLFRHQP